MRLLTAYGRAQLQGRAGTFTCSWGVNNSERKCHSLLVFTKSRLFFSIKYSNVQQSPIQPIPRTWHREWTTRINQASVFTRLHSLLFFMYKFVSRKHLFKKKIVRKFYSCFYPFKVLTKCVINYSMEITMDQPSFLNLVVDCYHQPLAFFLPNAIIYPDPSNLSHLDKSMSFIKPNSTSPFAS